MQIQYSQSSSKNEEKKKRRKFLLRSSMWKTIIVAKTQMHKRRIQLLSIEFVNFYSVNDLLFASLGQYGWETRYVCVCVHILAFSLAHVSKRKTNLRFARYFSYLYYGCARTREKNFKEKKRKKIERKIRKLPWCQPIIQFPTNTFLSDFEQIDLFDWHRMHFPLSKEFLNCLTSIQLPILHYLLWKQKLNGNKPYDKCYRCSKTQYCTRSDANTLQEKKKEEKIKEILNRK